MTLRKFIWALAFILCLFLLSSIAAPVQAAVTVTVKPSALNGWLLTQETATASGSFVTGPGAPPLGAGSVQMTLANATGGELLGMQLPSGTRFDQITKLEYSTWRSSLDSGNNLAIALQFDADYDLTDSSTPYQRRLIYEPYHTNGGGVFQNQWQTWDPLQGKWWMTAGGSYPAFVANAAVANQCPQAAPCTWADFLSKYPDAGIWTSSGLVGFKAGSNWSGFDGNIDKFTIGVNSSDTTYDFEPETQCTATCYVNTATGDNSFGGDTPTSAKKTIQAAVNQVSSGGQVVVAAGTYNENVVINKNGITLEGAVAFNPNDVPNPSVHTIISSGSPAVITSPGIQINSGITGVTIKNLRVENFSSSSGILGVVGNDGLTIDSVQVYGNNTNGMPVSGGIYMNGPVSNVTINKADVQNNKSRGIVIWNGFKQNITFTNNYIKGNTCCGIELQDGTASGVTVTGNTVLNNFDSGMAFTGLMAGAGPNLIANNTLTDNGRFGIEIKLPNGTGQTSGDGSIVVENNNVSMTGAIADQRDMAGISAYRRGWVSGNNNVDIPQGVVIRNNTVSGYQQSSNSDGFGIVVEGTGMSVSGNTLNNNDVGIQQQAGHLPYTPNTNVDGDQSNVADQYFGRGNSPVGCATIGSNTFSGNTVDTRSVGTSGGSVTNVNTGRFFCSIQSAIDDATTLNGHTLNVGAGTYAESVSVTKLLTLDGAGSGSNPAADTIISGSGSGTGLTLSAGTDATHRVTVKDVRVTNFSTGVVVGSYNTLDNVASMSNITYGINLSPLQDLVVTNSKFNNNPTGLKIASTASVDNVNISYSEFNNSSNIGWYSDKISGSPSNITNLNVSYTTFNDNVNKGFYTEKLSSAIFDHITINNSGTGGALNHRAGMDINLKYGNYSNIQILNSTITNNGTGDNNGGGILIKARSTGSYAGNPATLDDVTLTSLVVTGNGGGTYAAGIRVGESNNSFTGMDAGPTNVTISYSRISGNSVDGVRNATLTTTVMAENNWWGCNYGPGNTGTGCPVAANSATGSVDTTPYLVLKNAIAPPNILVYQSSNHSADLRFNSDNADTSGSGYIPNNTPASWTATLGSMSPTNNGTNNGTASSTFTSNGTVGTANLSLTVDGQTLSGDVAVTAPTATLISSLKGRQDGAQVKLVWKTASELNLTGINVWRARGKGEFVKLNAEPIAPLNPGNSSGSTYTYFDPLNKKGNYHYKLELLTTGEAQFTESITVRFKPAAGSCATVTDKAAKLSPKNKAKLNGNRVQFDWSDVACATRYEFTLRVKTVDGAVVATETNLQTSAYDVAKLKPDVYFWTVRACNDAGCGPERQAQFTLQRRR